MELFLDYKNVVGLVILMASFSGALLLGLYKINLIHQFPYPQNKNYELLLAYDRPVRLQMYALNVTKNVTLPLLAMVGLFIVIFPKVGIEQLIYLVSK